MTELTLKTRQGDHFAFHATYESDGTPANLTGYTAELVLTWSAYQSATSTRTEAGEILCTMAALDTTGVISGYLTSAQTATLPVGGGSRSGPSISWQLRITAAGESETLASGAVSVEPDLFALVS